MLLLQPFSASRVWGTLRTRAYGADQPQTGSVYSVAGTNKLDTAVFNPISGERQSFHQWAAENSKQLGLERGEVYPIIIDMLGADKDLSIQVHPNDAFAKSKGYPYGKSESWLFLTAPDSGTVYSGLRDDTQMPTASSFSDGKAEHVIGTESVNAGDYVFVPNSTLHAIRAGSMVYEIQQATDITYRLYDYGRLGLDGKPRELDVTDALQNLNPTHKVLKRFWQENQPINEVPYDLTVLTCKNRLEYRAPDGIATSVTVIAGSLDINHQQIGQGRSVIAFPKEVLAISGQGRLVMATPKRYW